jgi:2-dehydro-3-deoxyphosphogluconate aldolase/(4S)-4-hydroxy-2-oxoglutarate aldolase
MREQVIAAIEQEKIIAIVRGVGAEGCMKVAEALYAGGIRLMEVTFNQKEPESFQTTADIIETLGKAFEGRMLIGAGTVTTPELVELAAKAGAKFIISPDTNSEVIQRTRELGLVSMPGCMTPTEMMCAHRAGADFIKLFPAGDLGAGYVKSVRAPLNHLRVMAVGGVNEKNMKDFLDVGVCGFGIGGKLANKAWVEAGEFHKITEIAAEMVAIVKG